MLAYIPSPPQGVWHLGPFPVRAYALAIILGVVAAVCATLPGPSPRDRQAVMAMAATGPPTETVGLEPADPRLLPLKPVNV